jgi:ABC-type transport system involved in multi-copper enzyme maturation permease subunit
MSTTTTSSTPPTDTTPGGTALRVETAPSVVLTETPTFTRIIGFIGLFLLVLGAVAVITNEYLGPRWIGKGGGYLFSMCGLALMLYHAIRDGEQEVRRMYGMLAALWLVLAVASIIPGPLFESGVRDKKWGYNLVPWGVGFAMLGLLFTIPFIRHETEEKYRNAAEKGLLYVGAFLAIISLIAPVLGDVFPLLARNTLFKADFLAGPGVILGLLGLAFLCTYLGQTDTSEGIGYWLAFTVGAVGAGVAIYALGRAIVPTVLFEGPAVLRKPNGTLDWWKVAGRATVILFFGAIAALAAIRRFPNWLRIALVSVGGLGALVFLLGSYSSMLVHNPPTPSLVPGGLILIGLGGIYLAVALGICSDNQFVALTRRELSSYFLSPIGYLVLGGLVLIQWLGYRIFIYQLSRYGQQSQPAQEPIVSEYFFALFPVVALLLQVPALTMRLLSEEKRTGSLEVLLTAPVNEGPIVLSKFLATWLFFILTWLPSGLFLIALRYEVNQPFDYRPLLSFYVALATQGLAFVGMGLFFSSMTRNQIVAAVLTFVGMLFFLACFLIRNETFSIGLPTFVQTVLGKLSFIHMWGESLEGRLPLKDVMVFASLGVFFLFLSVKVLETRKWT